MREQIVISSGAKRGPNLYINFAVSYLDAVQIICIEKAAALATRLHSEKNCRRQPHTHHSF